MSVTSLFLSLSLSVYTHTHTKALQWDDPPTSTFHQISVNNTLEIPVTEYLERLNGMDQNIMLTF
jgi:hypothetical protein